MFSLLLYCIIAAVIYLALIAFVTVYNRREVTREYIISELITAAVAGVVFGGLSYVFTHIDAI